MTRSSGFNWDVDEWPRPKQGRVRAAANEVEHVLHARLARSAQAPLVGAADHHGTRAERESLSHVTAAADPAVHRYLDLVANRAGDVRQQPDRGRRPIQVVAAMVGDGEIAVTPASTARLASSILATPLSMNFPPHCSRSHATSSQLGGAEPCHCPYAPKNVGSTSRARPGSAR
jgi:hypothetical protein